MTTVKVSLPKENSTEYSHVVNLSIINSPSNKTTVGDKYLPLVQATCIQTNQISRYSLSDLSILSNLLGSLSPNI